jgi:hypothetical protein
MNLREIALIAAQGISLGALIVITQVYLFPQMGLFGMSVESASAAAFATFVVYTGLTIFYRSKLDEKSG